MSTWQAVAVGIIPSIGVALLFWFVMRAVIRADRHERAAIAAQEAAIDAAQAKDGDADVPEVDSGYSDGADSRAAGDA